MALTIDEQVAILMRGVEYGDDQIRRTMEAELRERLKAGRPLRVYLGVDPRTTDLHLGHTVPMRKLRQFQELGHDTTFLIGSFTSLIGDPSDKDKTRPQLTPEEVFANAQTYAEQAFKILDPKRTRIRYNSEWLAALSFADVIKLASNFTVQQFLARENFANRLNRNEPIFLHETFYALMQGYDAVAQEADVQIGGTDQLFNIIVAGRKLQQAFGQQPQIGIILPILVGTDGYIKMSKSLGNHIAINLSPEDMYGKVMSIPDHAMWNYYDLVTRLTPAEIASIRQAVGSSRMHPMEAKKRLAWEIVDIFHGSENANQAAEHFETVFQQRDLPTDMPAFTLTGPMGIIDLLVTANLAASRSEARRLIQQGGVKVDGTRVENIEQVIAPGEGAVLQVGRRKFLRLV